MSWTYYKGGAKGPSDYSVSKGSYTTSGAPYSRKNFAMERVSDNEFFVFGGIYSSTPGLDTFHDVWGFSVEKEKWVFLWGNSACCCTPDWTNVHTWSDSNDPGSRYAPTGVYLDGLIYILFGIDHTNDYHSDVYAFNHVTAQWTWMGGPDGYNGVSGVGAVGGGCSSSNYPPSRGYTSTWVGNNGEIFTFGGLGTSSATLHDVWKFIPPTVTGVGGQFCHIGGSTVKGSAGVYSVAGVYESAVSTYPPAKKDYCIARLNEDEVFFFGGARGNVLTRDIWTYRISSNQFKYIRGAAAEEAPVTGTTAVYAPNNQPGSRRGHACVGFSTYNEIFMFAGQGIDSDGLLEHLSDVWYFQVCPDCDAVATCDGGECICPPGYTGSYTTVCTPQCSPACILHATCVLPDVCQCDDGYSGVDCLPVCSMGCGRNASCVGPDHCQCRANYVGNPTPEIECVPECIPECPVNGKCIDVGVCECLPGFVSAPGPSCVDAGFTCSPACKANSQCVAPDTCQCDPGFTEKDQACVPECLSRVCVGNATCVAPNECECDEDYEGVGFDFCYPVCSNPECGESAECAAPEVCWCFAGYSGDPTTKCTPVCDDCGAHSQCIAPQVCQCDVGYELSIDACVPICRYPTCGDNATCIAPETCECPGGYQLSMDGNCIPACSACSEFATCIAPEHCQCDADYLGDGETCEAECNPECGTNAVCVKTDHCQCSREYFGDPLIECQPICSPACGLNATCVAPDKCQCNAGFSGIPLLKCDPVCEAEFQCAKYAQCVAPQTCQCGAGFSGSDAYAKCSPVCDPGCVKNAECVVGMAGNECVCSVGYEPVAVDEKNKVKKCEKVKTDDDDKKKISFYLAAIGAPIAAVILCLILTTVTVVVVLAVILTSRNRSKFQNLNAQLREKERQDATTARNTIVPGGIRNLALDMEMDETQKEEDLGLSKEMIAKLGDNVFVINFDEVKLLKEIGDGGSGAKIFQSDWDGKSTAYKVFKTKNILSDNEDWDEFTKELKVISALSHPNIIRFYGITIKAPRIGIVMEYCSNGDLYRYIEKEKLGKVKPLSFERKLSILKGIASALKYMHSRTIMHRDLKAKNVLLNDQLVPKVIDFGLSKALEVGTSQGQTKRIGTSNYMAPEVTLGEEYDYQCDVFSFSIICFEVLSNNLDPYGASGGGFIVEFRVAKNPDFRPVFTEETLDSTRNGDWLINLITSSWSHEPQERPTFSQICDILKENKPSVPKRK